MAEPQCSYFGNCGGCSTQHVEYSLQLENKKNVLAYAIKTQEIQVFQSEPYHFRNRMDLIFHPKGLGFRKKGKWDMIVNIDCCVIANPRINTLLTEIKNFFPTVDSFDLKKQTGTFRFAVIRTLKNDSSISFMLNEDSSRIKEAVENIKIFAEKTTAQNVLISYTPKETDVAVSEDYFVVKGKDILYEECLNKTFFFSAQGFYQNNTIMAEKMHSYCHDILKQYDTKESTLLDFYGGVGTFGIMNAELFKKIIVVESYEASINAAKENFLVNNVKNGEAYTLDARQIHKLDLQKPLFVITDPPRSGMHPKAIKHLEAFQPKVIIYVSCNIKQLQKELSLFKDYQIRSAALFDFFPHTSHAEAVLELVKKES